MSAASLELGMEVGELKTQRASRRATSLSKDRAEYKKQLHASGRTNRKLSAGPVGSDFAHPHRMARAATRTCLAKGQLDSSSDMPQISMGRAGAWTRWIRKPSVSTILNQPTFTQEQTVELTAEEQQKILNEVEDEGRAMLEAVRLRVAETAKNIASEHVGTDKESIWNAALSILNVAHDGENADEALSFDGDVVEHCKSQTNTDCVTPLVPVSAACFDGDLLDDVAFPRLVVPQHKSIPTESSSGMTKSEPEGESQVEDGTKDELLEDWIMLPCDDTKDKSLTTQSKSFDGRHPRHVFAKQAIAKRTKSNTEAWEFDWSQAGIPREIKRQLIHGSTDASHRSIHANKQSVPLSLSALRQQSIGSSRRQSSTPRTPRSQSKPRMIQQPAKRR